MKAVIAGFARTPFHFAHKGALSTVRPDTLAALAVRALLSRVPFDETQLDDVILGCAYPEGVQGANLARIVSLLAGLPHHVPGMTVNRFCGSSMSAVHIAASQIEAGMGEAFLCVGAESMSLVPRGGANIQPNPVLADRSDAYVSMGQTAENVARAYGVSRADQEELAVASHRKAAHARQAGLLDAELVAVPLPGAPDVAQDGCIRPGTSAERLAALAPAFGPQGVVTAGTSSPLTDGASAVLVVADHVAERRGLTPLARIRSFATVGVDPALMGMGPVPATRLALARAGLSVSDLDLVEINEAFASQALACMRELGLSPDICNLDGGGMAIGHPLGATGARLTGKAASLMVREGARYALATQCIGGGQGIATVLEAMR